MSVGFLPIFVMTSAPSLLLMATVSAIIRPYSERFFIALLLFREALALSLNFRPLKLHARLNTMPRRNCTVFLLFNDKLESRKSRPTALPKFFGRHGIRCSLPSSRRYLTAVA